MTVHRTKIAATFCMISAPLASAGQFFNFLSAERYVKGIADCGPHIDPPLIDEGRIDAEGFEHFIGDLQVSVVALPNCLVSARVVQNSRFWAEGLSTFGSAEADPGIAPGNFAATRSFYHAEFSLTESADVTVYLRATQTRDNDLGFVNIALTGPGVDITLGGGTGMQEFVFDGVVSFQAGETYSFNFDMDAGEGLSRITYETHIYIPAPGAATMLFAGAPFLTSRRRCTTNLAGKRSSS